MSDNTTDYTFKILIIGDSGVGKTGFLHRLIEGSFSESFETTIGVDFKTKNFQVDGKKIKTQFWDTAGQERFRSITRAYIRGTQGTLLLYDITNRNTFNSLVEWLGYFKEYPNNLIVLLGNKCDLTERREVTKEEAQKFITITKNQN